MSLNLTIDQGNTVAKMALWDDTRLIDIVNEPHLCAQTVERFAQGRAPIDAAIYCSVSDDGSDVLPSIKHIAKRVCRLSSRCRLPIKIDYGALAHSAQTVLRLLWEQCRYILSKIYWWWMPAQL